MTPKEKKEIEDQILKLKMKKEHTLEDKIKIQKLQQKLDESQ